MTPEILTIGYEGADIDSFLATLTSAGVKHLFDVRDLPISRKRGFSKSSLALALNSAGIEYSHLKALGDPKPGRDAMRRGDYNEFLKIYLAHVGSDAAQKALDDVAEVACKTTSVLLCYERSPKECHRTLIVEHLQSRGSFRVKHLGVQKTNTPLVNKIPRIITSIPVPAPA